MKEFEPFGTSTISDALDRLEIVGQALGLKPVGTARRIQGRAFTVRYVPAATQRSTAGDFIDDVGRDEVVVIDNGGRLDATVWGDILTMAAHRRGVRGTIINGACRDSEASEALAYPLFTRGTHMRTGKGRVDLAGIGDTISIGQCRVRPGDLIVGDSDGVVVIPAESELETLQHCRDIEEAENEIREAVLGGESLRSARGRFGYFDLQTPPGKRVGR